MADDPESRTPDAIKKHKTQKTFEMRGPGGSSIRKDMANQRVQKDQEKFGGDRATKYVNMERQKIADKENVRDGDRGRLSKHFSRSPDDRER